jgi:hypothetical protein
VRSLPPVRVQVSEPLAKCLSGNLSKRVKVVRFEGTILQR